MDGLIKNILKPPKIKMRLVVKLYKGIRLEGQRNEKNGEKNHIKSNKEYFEEQTK